MEMNQIRTACLNILSPSFKSYWKRLIGLMLLKLTSVLLPMKL
jgi:hypothetical protein